MPFITQRMFAGDAPSFALLNAFPLCRIEDDRFVPRYTLTILSYFNPQPRLVIQRHYEEELKFGRGDPDFYPRNFPNPSREAACNSMYDLQSYAEKGVLGYIDLEKEDSPIIQLGQGLQLPRYYKRTEEQKGAYRWRDGKITYFHHTGHPITD